MSARTVTLPEQLTDFVDNEVRSGRHQDASDVVREALRRYQDSILAERARVEEIRQTIRDGREAIKAGRYNTIATPQESDALLTRLTDNPAARGTGQSG